MIDRTLMIVERALVAHELKSSADYRAFKEQNSNRSLPVLRYIHADAV